MENPDSRLFECDIMPSWNIFVNNFGQRSTAKTLGLKPPNIVFNSTDVKARSSVKSMFASNNYWTNEWNDVFEMYKIVVHIEKSQYTKSQRRRIRRSLRSLARNSGVLYFSFQNNRPTNARPFISIGKSQGDGCWSYVGQQKSAFQPGGQPLSLSSGCLFRNVIQHNMMHALGFFHEQLRSDRDAYVSIIFSNIKDGYRRAFGKKTSSQVSSFGTPYDIKSILHFSSTMYSKNGNATITSVKGINIETAKKLSQFDLTRLRLVYQCKKDSTGAHIRSYPAYKNNATQCDMRCGCGRNWGGCSRHYECKGDRMCVKGRCKGVEKKRKARQ